jgi:hypothetical protein
MELDFKFELIPHKGWYPVIRVITERELLPVVCIADLHYGHQNHDTETFHNVVKWIKDNGALVYLVGDLIDNGNKRSIADSSYTQVKTPQQQIEGITEELMPIKNQIAGSVCGNHEDRTFKEMGIDVSAIIAGNLGVYYVGAELFSCICRHMYSKSTKAKVKGIAYSLYAVHSTRTAKTTGLTYNMVERDWLKFLHFDLIVKAHGHDMGLSEPKISYEMNFINPNVNIKEKRVWLTGNYLKRVNSYAAKGPYGPKPLGTMAAWLHLKPGEKYIRGEEIK